MTCQMKINLTFLATRELRPFSANLSLKAIWQTVDEPKDVRVSTSLLDLHLRDFFDRFIGTKKDVELDCSVIQSWFLGH